MLDAAIVRALNLDPSGAALASHGSSIVTSTGRVEAKRKDGSKAVFFVKQSQDKDAEAMFAGEHMSLNAIHAIDPSLCPASHAHGQLADSPGYFLATDFLDLTGSRFSPSVANRSLAEKLAKLHAAPVPAMGDDSAPRFGFPVATACGSTMQDNTPSDSWADFYADRRLRAIGKEAERNNGKDADIALWVERTASIVVPRLLADGHLGGSAGIKPSVVHGDLWNGNKGIAASGEPVVFDPSGCYAHHEYDHGIMHMFGGFPRGFWQEYHAILPKTEPAAEWEDRVKLYELYHQLNHYSMFGSGYKSGAIGIMRDLWSRYGDGGAT